MYNPFKQLTDYLRYREAVKMADDAHAKDGDRYYVVASNNEKGKPGLIIMDRKNFRRLRFKGYINKKANIRDLVAECFYCTPYASGDGYLDAAGRKLKQALYFSYCESVRKINKQRKKNEKKQC